MSRSNFQSPSVHSRPKEIPYRGNEFPEFRVVRYPRNLEEVSHYSASVHCVCKANGASNAESIQRVFASHMDLVSCKEKSETKEAAR